MNLQALPPAAVTVAIQHIIQNVAVRAFHLLMSQGITLLAAVDTVFNTVYERSEASGSAKLCMHHSMHLTRHCLGFSKPSRCSTGYQWTNMYKSVPHVCRHVYTMVVCNPSLSHHEHNGECKLDTHSIDQHWQYAIAYQYQCSAIAKAVKS